MEKKRGRRKEDERREERVRDRRSHRSGSEARCNRRQRRAVQKIMKPRDRSNAN